MASGSIENDPVFVLRLNKHELENLRILAYNHKALAGVAHVDSEVCLDLFHVIQDLKEMV